MNEQGAGTAPVMAGRTVAGRIMIEFLTGSPEAMAPSDGSGRIGPGRAAAAPLAGRDGADARQGGSKITRAQRGAQGRAGACFAIMLDAPPGCLLLVGAGRMRA